MRLNYKILWCEDDAEWLEEAQLYLIDHLKNLGFVAIIEVVRSEDIKDLEEKLANSHDYDVILMDYKYNDKPMGEQYIKKIRDQSIYAEVIFYSGVNKADLYEQVAKHNLDGVYVAPRAGDEFYTKVKKVIETTIKKVLDVNAMRGIVMASTSEIDKKFYEIIKIFHDNKLDADKQKALRGAILDRIGRRLEEKKTEYGKVDPLNPWEYLGSTIRFGADLRFITLKKEILEDVLNAKEPSSEWHEIYQTILGYQEINKTRNLLAHEKEKKELRDGKTVILVDQLVFDEAFGIELRKKLVVQEEKVTELYDKISQK